MIAEAIMEGIKSVGFPIVAFLLMYHHSTKSLKENTKAIVELTTYIRK